MLYRGEDAMEVSTELYREILLQVNEKLYEKGIVTEEVYSGAKEKIVKAVMP